MGVIDEFRKELRAIGRAIRTRRRAMKLSQEELADRTGSHRNYIGRIERGEHNPSTATLIAIARALRARPADLFEDIT